MTLLPPAAARFGVGAGVLVAGAGACGLVAALAARERTGEVLVFERDPRPAGSTAMSSGMIPAAGTRFQRARGVEDSPALMAADVLAKSGCEADRPMVERLCRAAGPTVEWLADGNGVDLALVEGFLYPGHRRARMHAPPSMTGEALIGALTAAAERAGVDVVCSMRVRALFADPDGRVRGVRAERPDGTAEDVACRALVLATCGFGADRDLVARHIPALEGAEYHGHPGNEGDALRFGVALGAATRHLGAWQGHGSLAWPHRILITWALMAEGAIQVNARGERFANEHRGYSEQALDVLAQPGRIAFDVFDERRLALARGFEDFRRAEAAGAVLSGDTPAALAARCRIDAAGLERTLADVARFQRGEAADPLGRDFTGKPALEPPYHAVRVTGALFHTQGGLVVDRDARVLRQDGSPLPNLFAGGGAACGVSGPSPAGYLSGNGLLTAVVLGRIAGQRATAP